MSNGISANGTHSTSNNARTPRADDIVFQFNRQIGPCKLCNTQLPPTQDLPIHWQGCSTQNRAELKATPSIYLHQMNLAESDFQNLKNTRDPVDVNAEARKVLWMLHGIERVGEVDYRGFLESLRDNGYADSDLKRDIIDIMLGNLNRNGNVLSTVLAIEDALHYNSSSGLLHADDPTMDVKFLPYWKMYEVEFLRDQVHAGKKFGEILGEFVGWDRVKGDALPGRNGLGVAVWLFKVKVAGNDI
ncbi:hypothetical protein PRZ48_013977 [Zasmidium cellare]|uniref:Uncharacterized protein n=1 Tax=Zasmidium cellare TaxID=395010 RepID=A0ABR0E0A0_ZASCE|nr:hypothetical protein PRZ48_013977 [Zasmidium cellare]